MSVTVICACPWLIWARLEYEDVIDDAHVHDRGSQSSDKSSPGISLPCLHGPFCEGCLSVWSRVNRTCPACRKKTGYDDTDCWVHLEEPDLDEIVEGLYLFIRKL